MSEICNLWFGPLDGQHINRFLRSVTAHVTAERFIYRVGFRPLDSAFQIARITERITANESLSFLQPLLSSWTKSSHYWNFSTIIITQICFSVWRWKKKQKKREKNKENGDQKAFPIRMPKFVQMNARFLRRIIWLCACRLTTYTSYESGICGVLGKCK